jgi:hypothetical protein
MMPIIEIRGYQGSGWGADRRSCAFLRVPFSGHTPSNTVSAIPIIN